MLANTPSLEEIEQAKQRYWGSLLLFTQSFFKLRTGKDFTLSQPLGLESHFITIAKALTRVFRGECRRLIINVPPRYG